MSGAEHPEPAEPAWPVFTTGLGPLGILTNRGFPHLYSECAEIWNPIHTERAVALAAGLEDILIHGTAIWALTGLSVKATGRPLTRLAARFRSPAWAGKVMNIEIGDPVNNQTAFRLTSRDGRLLCEGFGEH